MGRIKIKKKTITMSLKTGLNTLDTLGTYNSESMNFKYRMVTYLRQTHLSKLNYY